MLASGLTALSFIVEIKGRTLISRLKQILKNCKKALSIANRYDSPYKGFSSTGALPSGMCLDDYYLFIRQKMFQRLRPPPILPAISSIGTASDDVVGGDGNEILISAARPAEEIEDPVLD